MATNKRDYQEEIYNVTLSRDHVFKAIKTLSAKMYHCEDIQMIIFLLDDINTETKHYLKMDKKLKKLKEKLS